jgi:hypothetical protein
VYHFHSVRCKEYVNIVTIVDGLRCTGYADNALSKVNVWVCYNFDEEFLAHRQTKSFSYLSDYETSI